MIKKNISIQAIDGVEVEIFVIFVLLFVSLFFTFDIEPSFDDDFDLVDTAISILVPAALNHTHKRS